MTVPEALLAKVTLGFTVTAAKFGCDRPLIEVRVVDTDPEPMSGPYCEVVVSARFLLSDYEAMNSQPFTLPYEHSKERQQ